MLDSLHCFFVGHDYDNATVRYAPVPDNLLYRVDAHKTVTCPRCLENIESAAALPPLGIHHGRVFERESVILDEHTLFYKAACWCGWASRWFMRYEEADSQRNVHEITGD